MNIRPGVHWQLVFFSWIALLHGAVYTLRLSLQVQGELPPGIQELPIPVLILETVGWILAGGFGVTVAVFLRRWYIGARTAIGVICGAWAGAYLYGWLWQDHPYEWFAAGFYLGLAGAVLAPVPLWQVKIPAGKR